MFTFLIYMFVLFLILTMLFPNSMSTVFYIVYVYIEFSHKTMMKNELK